MTRGTIIVIALLITGCSEQGRIMTVTGYVDASKLGNALPHEHVLVDFIGADSVGPHRYNQDSAFQVILPHLANLADSDGETLFECTPAYLGRDPILLRRLATASGLTIVTNTGYYGARAEKYYPDHAFTESAEQISKRWVTEWQEGIGDTGIRPGFMKLGSDRGPLTEMQKKMVHAAALTHLQTGMTVAIHSGDGAAAQEELSILVADGVAPEAFVWVHAQNERDSTIHRELARIGAWIEFDGLNDNNVSRYVDYLEFARKNNFLHKVLISQDAGWYNVGESGGGRYRGHTMLTVNLVPALERAGFTAGEIKQVTAKNPSAAFAIRVRRR